jgi:GNAT superfamily N-acetyltransferase
MNIRELAYSEVEPYGEAVKAEGAGTINPNYVYYGLFEDDTLVSFGAMICKGSNVKLMNGFTLPEYRGRGYHEALNAFRIEKAKELGMKKITGSCTPMSLHVKLRQGFREISKTSAGYTRVELDIGGE